MRARGAIAIVVCIVLAPFAAHSQSLVFDAPQAAPDDYVRLIWRHESKDSIGYWYSAEQVLRVSQRIDYLETQAAKQCVDQQVASFKSSHTFWYGLIMGVVGGVAVGYVAAKKL